MLLVIAGGQGSAAKTFRRRGLSGQSAGFQAGRPMTAKPSRYRAVRRLQRCANPRSFPAPDCTPPIIPLLPEIRAKGQESRDVFACGFATEADGRAARKTRHLPGFRTSYIKAADGRISRMAQGKLPCPERGPPQLMIALAKAASEQEVQASAEYFAALKPSPLIKVVETETVPKTYVRGMVSGRFRKRPERGDREPHYRSPRGRRAVRKPRCTIPLHRLCSNG